MELIRLEFLCFVSHSRHKERFWDRRFASGTFPPVARWTHLQTGSPKALVTDKFKPNWYPFWSPRFWHGMRMGDYFRLLQRNRFAIHPARWPLTCSVAALSVVNSFWSGLQTAFLRRKVQQTRIEHPPIFIIGHWRTGTTMLHEFLTCDPRFAFATNYDCFAANHFLLTRPLFSPFIGWLLPQRRPMDDMPLGAEFPQEDEFALCTLGAPTPYTRIAFPNRTPLDLDLLNLDTASPAKVERFRVALDYFFKALTYHYGGRQLVLKSPPHTGRIRKLAQWYPGARFIHLSRDPIRVFGSTLRLWRTLDRVQGFQLARYSDSQLQDFVIASLRQMYEAYFAQRDTLSPDQLVELRFEDLLADPLGEMQQVYERLRLGPFSDETCRRMMEYLENRKDYRGITSRVDPATELKLRDQWSAYFDAFGYSGTSVRWEQARRRPSNARSG